MERFNKEERYLRDTLTILEDNVPKKRKRFEITGDEDGVGHEIVQAERKSRLNQLLPIFMSGPLGFDGGLVENDEIQDSSQNISQRTDDEDKDACDDSGDAGDGDKSGDGKSESMTCYELQLKRLKEETQELDSKTTKIFSDYAKLVSAYESGLRRISELKDLTAAPDNILEGNFTSTNI
jgi:hypothetical protein